MSTVFKREFRGLFSCGTGWFCLISLAFSVGVLTTVNNLLSLSADVSRIFPILCDLLVLICPLLASHAIAFERVNANCRWLQSLPLSRMAIVGGKYLSNMALFGICALYFALFPLLIGMWGTVSYGTAYTALFGWLLIAAAVLAVSFLVASRTRTRRAAVLLGVSVCLVLYCLPLLASLIAYRQWSGVLFLSLVAVGISVPSVLRDVRASRVPLRGICTVLSTCAISLVLFFFVEPFYTRILPNCLDAVALFGRLDGFRNGHIDLPGVFLLVSVSAICLFLTVVLPTPRSHGDSADRKGGV